MRRLRCFLQAVILACSVSTVASAGDMQGPGFTNPPPPPTAGATAEASSIQADATIGENLLLEFLTLVF